jgi:hypothetical protein
MALQIYNFRLNMLSETEKKNIFRFHYNFRTKFHRSQPKGYNMMPLVELWNFLHDLVIASPHLGRAKSA